jgi:hypothetical protein
MKKVKFILLLVILMTSFSGCTKKEVDNGLYSCITEDTNEKFLLKVFDGNKCDMNSDGKWITETKEAKKNNAYLKLVPDKDVDNSFQIMAIQSESEENMGSLTNINGKVKIYTKSNWGIPLIANCNKNK